MPINKHSFSNPSDLPDYFPPTTQYTIHGITNDNTKFRPSDWTERLVCIQPEQLKRYKGQIKISRSLEYKSIIFTNKLEMNCGVTFYRLLDFARIHDLRVDIVSL